MKYLEIPKRKSHQNSSTAKILESTKVSQINDIEKERERDVISDVMIYNCLITL